MSPVKELCARLDELGIKYKTFNYDSGTVVRFYLPDCREVEYADFCWDETQLCVLGATPEQVIAATVGAGTCVDKDSDPNDFKCSACGAHSYIRANDTYTTVLDDHVTILKKFNYCPNCGRRIEVNE